MARKSTLQLSTNGNKTIRENITNVFGAKILSSLEQVNFKLDIDIRHIGGKRSKETVEVQGYVSKSAHGEGRSSADRQFFYVNSRPCLQPKVLHQVVCVPLTGQMARTFNEIYRSYNSHQYPFILVDLKLASGTFDINLTPDKRTILLHEEQTLIKELNVPTHILRDLMVGSLDAILRLVSAFPADKSIHPVPETTEDRDY
jgi:DNA mismatch repair protein PMS2